MIYKDTSITNAKQLQRFVYMTSELQIRDDVIKKKTSYFK